MLSCFNAQAETVRVLAASSMTNVMQNVATQYPMRLQNVFAGSASLARQISSGAPVDLYISASPAWVNYLVEQGVIDEAQINKLATNQLVLIAPKYSEITVSPPEIKDSNWWSKNLANTRLAVANTRSVPAGIYAKQSLQSAGSWNAVKSRLASTSNVRRALALVERGEAELGIVYKTDAILSDNVTIIHHFEPNSHDDIVYPVVYFNQKGKKLADYLLSKGQRTLVHYGFVAVDGNGDQNAQ
ncbi:molybdate ABC transporter substrate-binding protein [Vibrio sp. SCSIO 43136]|uniref:molybdate ABC transporter substrate-binding protein n=1 Tax=Vibrio sp. SCSIO 43136 TaxID=2819101 RepID=UPI002075A00D|nr:molybdate ABC transporter substrate-binding protein [Vibrio sp. SCSIO 43136]USD66734.1 molybdate ABC transporter substrate-binding protein [Vibrio sp. SCSIO 43136]